MKGGRSMKLLEFVQKNQREIDAFINANVGNNSNIDDEERENWVMNDEGLYGWALNAGVIDI